MAIITGTNGNDTITPSGVSPGVTGGVPSDAADEIAGLSGDDVIESGGGGDLIEGGEGNDTLDGGGEGENYVDGGEGNDTLTGGRLVGGPGDDFMTSNADGDDLSEIDYSNVTSGILVQLTGAISTSLVRAQDINDQSVGIDRIGNFQTLIGSQFSDNIVVDADFDRGIPGSSNIIIIEPGPGDDNITGLGNNLGLSYSDSPESLNFDLATGRVADGFGTVDTFSGVNWVRGTYYDDTLLGSDNPELENFIGSAGNDIIDGRGGFNQADYYGTDAPHGAIINLIAGNVADDGFGGTDKLFNIQDVIGTDFADDVTGDNGSNGLYGRGGDDIIRGLAGDDFIEGESGQDMLSGNLGNDELWGGADNDVLTGGFGSDSLWGEDGNDRLRGGFGDDIIDGGYGDDLLIGGFGADNLVFAPGGGSDIVRGFQAGLDLLDVTAFDYNSVEEVLDAASQVGRSTLITLDADIGDNVTLVGTPLSSLDGDNFLI